MCLKLEGGKNQRKSKQPKKKKGNFAKWNDEQRRD